MFFKPELHVLNKKTLLKISLNPGPEEQQESTLKAVRFREVSVSFRLALSVHPRSRCPA